jgi:hypothetical protein
VRVEEKWISLAILRMLELEKTVVEGAAAAPLAAMMSGGVGGLKGKRVALVVCGGNIDPVILSRVIEKGLVHDGSLTRFTVRIIDRPGGLAELCRVIAACGASVNQIDHDRAFSGPDVSATHVVCTVETRDRKHVALAPPGAPEGGLPLVRLRSRASLVARCWLAARRGPAAAPVTLDVPVFQGATASRSTRRRPGIFEAARPGVRSRLRQPADPGPGPDPDHRRPPAGPGLRALHPLDLAGRAGKMVDLRPYLDGPNWEGDGRWGDTFLPGALDSWRIDGGVYGLPFVYSCWSIFYNRGPLPAHGWTEPRTWDEFFALCDRMRAAGVAPVSLPGTRWLYPDAFFRAAYHNLAGPGRLAGDQ